MSSSLLLTLLLLAACGSDFKTMQLYAGTERPDAEIARLFFSESLEVSSVNGEPIPGIPRIVRSGDRRLDLLPGDYGVVVYYEAVWPINSSDDELVRSESQHLDLALEAGHLYRVGHRPPIDLEDARNLARDLRLTVVDIQRGESVQLAVESRPAVSDATLVVSPASAADAPQAPRALASLKVWWQRSSPQDRVEFLDWIEESSR